MMIKQTFLIFSLFLFGMTVISQAQNTGAIDLNMLSKLRHDFNQDENAKAMMNAASANDIKKLTMNRENPDKSDTFFTYRVESSGITNQKSTGRCWLFTGLNVFRARVIEEKNLENFSFSQSFDFFYDQLEKSNLFLEGIIATADKPMDDKKVDWLFKNPIGDGGQWTGVVDIIGKYGLVPSEIFPESFNSENTSSLSRLLRSKLREDGLKLRELYAKGTKESALRGTKTVMLGDIYRILAIMLGEPPTEFEWRYKDKNGDLSELEKYTPITFFKEFVNVDLNDYVMFMNDPSRPYGQVYEIENDRHVFEGSNWKYLNLEADKIKAFAVNSIKGNEALYFSCDVGKQLDRSNGYLDINNYDVSDLLGVKFSMDKKQRIETFESSSTHGMALMGVDIQDSKPEKWLLENSWGDSGFKGHLIMTDAWFSEYMFRLVVNKKYVDDATLKLFEEKPVMLPPWDPMFSPEN